MLTKHEVLATLRLLNAALRSPVWLAGGIAADFHVGRWTRDHDDIDLVTLAEHRTALSDDLQRCGFTQTGDAGWITRWTRFGRDPGEVSLAYEERTDDTTGRLVISAEHASDGLVPGIYPGVPGNLDPARYRRVEDVRFRVVSAEDEWAFTTGYTSLRPGARRRPAVDHNLRLLESVVPERERARLRAWAGLRLPLPSPGGVTLRPLRDPGDLRRMQALASRLWPLGFHPGGLMWSVATDQFGEATLYEQDGVLLGFGGTEGPEILLAQADPARPDAAAAIVKAFVDTDSSARLRVGVVDADAALRKAVQDAGFVRLDHERPVYLMRRTATTKRSTSGHGYAVRAAEPHETAARIEVHREAWNPQALPWHPDHRPDYPPDARSGHSADIYSRVRAAPMYDPELDLVAVAADGTFAGCCIVWLDHATGVAEIEPLGVVPAHRRRGVAGALCDEACRRVAQRHGREVIINSGPNTAYPAPPGAYAKAGFEVVDRGRNYLLSR